MYLLNATLRKLRYIIFLFILNEVLDEVYGTPKDVLIGFIKSPPTVGIPYFVVSSVDMTASICCDVCYLNRTTFAVILDQSCTCTNNLLDIVLADCVMGRPCPGNSTESCGCDDNNYAIVYSNGSLITYTVSVVTATTMDRLTPGFKGDVYFNIFGPDGRECREVASFNVNFVSGTLTQFNVGCRDLKGFAKMRLGHSNKKNGWTVDKVTIDDPAAKTSYSFARCGPIYLGDETGNGTMAEFRANSSCAFPIKGDNYFSIEEYTSSTVIVCSSGFRDAACKADTTTGSEYIAFARYFHKHVFPLTGMVYFEKYDCDNISVIAPNVNHTRREGSGIGSSYLFNCTNGYFIGANNSRTRTIKPVCQATGLWSVDPIPECVPACFGKMPGTDISSSTATQPITIAGDTIVFSCKNGVFDGFTEPCNRLEIVCLTTGNWSLTSIPNCTPTSKQSMANTEDHEVTCPNGGMY